MIPFGQFAPDLPSLLLPNDSPRNQRAINAVPASMGYQPFYSFSPVSTALDSRALGGISVLRNDASVYTVVGDSGKLYSISPSVSNISKTGNYTITSTDERWRFVTFGNLLIASHYDVPVQSFNLTSGTLFDDHITSTLKPKAKYMAVIGEFLVLANTSEGGTAYPYRVRWPSINDSTNFDPSVSRQSDFQDILDGGHVTGIVGNKEYGVVILEKDLRRMEYVGGQLIFRFDKIQGSRGSQVPESIIGYGENVFYYSTSGWTKFDGANCVPIGSERVDAFFQRTFDYSYRSRMTVAVDPRTKLFICAYAGAGTATNGVPNMALLYRWDIDRWASIEGISVELLFSLLAISLTLEDLDAISANLDLLGASLDSTIYSDGRLLLGGVDSNHRVGSFAGAAMTAEIDTGDVELNPGKLTYLEELTPIVNGTSDTVLSVSVMTRGRQNDDVYTASAFINQLFTGEIPCEDIPSNNYHRFRLRIEGGFTNAIGIDNIISHADGSQ